MIAKTEWYDAGSHIWFLRLVIMVLMVNGGDRAMSASGTGEDWSDLSAGEKSGE
jgi:hypothetical protein